MGSKKIIDDQQQIEEILSKAKFLRLALSDADIPHIIPMAFGYKDNSIYLHSSQEGEKIDILKKNPRVCFEADIDADIITQMISANIMSVTGVSSGTGRQSFWKTTMRK